MNRVILEATAGKFADLAIEARLGLGEIQMNFGDREIGRAILQSVQRESAKAGFVVLARKAAEALRAPSGRSST
jgi:hypothetical protein